MRAQGATIVDNVRFSEFNSNYTFSEDLDWTLGLRVSIRESMLAFHLFMHTGN